MNIMGLFSVALITQSLNFGEIVQLPQARVKGVTTLEESIARRRSVREFSSKTLSTEQIGQLLWAAQGITGKENGLRSAPSAGALYPLEAYVVLPSGIYHYNPERHELRRIAEGDKRTELQKAALDQEAVGSAPAILVIAADYDRTAIKYGNRTNRYVHMEAGHACQNVLLQATAQELVTVPIGAFDDKRVARITNLPQNLSPLYLVPVGYRKE